jgi:hypothetical protein
MSPTAEGQTGADLPVGDAPAPPMIQDNMADHAYDVRAMQRARSILEDEHGGARVAKLQADLLEWAPTGDGYSWEVEGWYGGDIDRLAFKTEGEGRSGEGVETAEVQLLYSRAVARYTDLQAGVRYDLEPRGRAYATVGVDALFPYWFEAEGALFPRDRLCAQGAEGRPGPLRTARLLDLFEPVPQPADPAVGRPAQHHGVGPAARVDDAAGTDPDGPGPAHPAAGRHAARARPQDPILA